MHDTGAGAGLAGVGVPARAACVLAACLWAVCLCICGPAWARDTAPGVTAPQAVLEPPPLRIAAIFALTGDVAANNAPSMAGVRMGVGEVNRRGGVLGRRLELISLDNFGSSIGSMKAAKEAAELNVAAIIGPAWSSHAMAVARVAQERGIPMITNIATHPDVTATGDYVFRACYTDAFQGRILAEFAHGALDARTAAMAVDVTSDFSIGLAEQFRTSFEAQGGAILQERIYKRTQESYAELAAGLGRPDSDVCLIPGHDESGAIVHRMQEAGTVCIPLGGDGWVGETFLRRGGRLMRRGYYCTHWHPDSDSPVSRDFVQHYGKLAQLSGDMALAYDAVLLLADAVERAGAVEHRAIRDALAATRGFEGVTGSFTFNEQGDPVKAAVILEIEHGRTRLLERVEPN